MKSSFLIKVLIDKKYSGPLSKDLMEFLLSIESFDVNTRIIYTDPGDTFVDNHDLTAFFHILVLEKRLSAPLLPAVLSDPRLDVFAPTGRITFCIDSGELTYTNVPIIFLASAIGNFWAILYLIGHGEISKTTRIDKFLIFIFWHVLTVFWKYFMISIKKHLMIISKYNFNK